jgi:hypothetical protein
MDRLTLQAMVARRDVRLLALSPSEPVQGMVFDAVCGLGSPPTIPELAHWTDLTERHVKRALERLKRVGLVEEAGRVIRSRSSWQTWQPGVACRTS